jgi:hypothetical protein
MLHYFPDQWKEAKVIMLQKPNKDHASPLNFRPITLLNSLGKVFENIILKRLNFKIKKLQIIRNDQHGFRKGHSTAQASLRNIDKVWITGQIARLIKAIISPHLVHVIHSYLHNRSFFVTHGRSYSSRHAISSPGQSTWAHTFNIHIKDIPPTENDSKIATPVYANDKNIRQIRHSNCAIKQSNRPPLQPCALTWRMKVNINKSTTTLFCNVYSITAAAFPH